MKKIFRVLVILTLCIFGIAYKKKMCVAILKYYNNLKDNMGMAFTNIFLICIAIFCLIVVFWYIERLIHKKKDYIRGGFLEEHQRINIILAVDLITIIVLAAGVILRSIVKGVYDKWAIQWGYRYRPEFKDPYKEKDEIGRAHV